MDVGSYLDVQEDRFQCPACGREFQSEAAQSHLASACPGCGSLLWCRVGLQQDKVILQVCPGRTPSLEDLERFTGNLLDWDASAHVVCRLDDLEYIDSLQISRLVGLNRRLRASGIRLTLCGLRPLVQDVFIRLRLEFVLEIADRSLQNVSRLGLTG